MINVWFGALFGASFLKLPLLLRDLRWTGCVLCCSLWNAATKWWVLGGAEPPQLSAITYLCNVRFVEQGLINDYHQVTKPKLAMQLKKYTRLYSTLYIHLAIV